MHILAPHISCVCVPHELPEVIALEYKEIYIITGNGIFKHHILRNLNGTDRYVRVKVDKIPGYTEAKIEEGMNFLPAGKIPYPIYEQVLAFFLKVMEVKVAEVEAMIHVLYNKELGYHLGVPPQTISKASVSYSWDYIPVGTSIIVDIHSHNTMSAFFSGTDDRDDRGNISFSGVFGKLKDAEPMTIWRFNYFDKKYAASVADLFETPIRPVVEVPKEWIENVNVVVPTYPTIYTGGYSNQGNVLGGLGPNATRGPSPTAGKTHGQLAKWGYSPAEQTTTHSSNPGQVKRPTTARSFETSGEDDLLHFFGGDLMDTMEANFNARGNPISTVDNQSLDPAFDFTYFDPSTGTMKPNPQSQDQDDPVYGIRLIQEEDDEADPVGKSSGELSLMDETGGPQDGTIDPQYEIIKSVHGVDVANAWYSIATEMSTLDGKDELNAELICDMAGLTTDEGQLEIMKALFNRLSKKNQISIQTHGF